MHPPDKRTAPGANQEADQQNKQNRLYQNQQDIQEKALESSSVSMARFLNHIHTDDGIKCHIAIRKNADGTIDKRQNFCRSHIELENALRYIDGNQSNAFFACAVFKTSTNRKQENALGAKALWLDIDAGADKPYATAEAAIEAVTAFAEKMGLPIPTIVLTGNGIHAWWAFDKLIPADEWTRTAVTFKRLTVIYGLHADPSRTADIASILRAPDTHNWKDPANPKLVRCEALEPPINADWIIKHIANLAAHIPKPQNKKTDRGILRDCTSGAIQEWSEDDVWCMLSFLDPGCDYHTWVNIGMALHAGGFSLSMWDQWSRGSKEKYQPGCCESRWGTFRQHGAITMGTLVHLAKTQGWRSERRLSRGDAINVDPLVKKILARFAKGKGERP